MNYSYKYLISCVLLVVSASVFSEVKFKRANKLGFCYSLRAIVKHGKLLSYELPYDTREGLSGKYYSGVDLDKDGLMDELSIGCGSSGECGFSAMISGGDEFYVADNFMFTLAKYREKLILVSFNVEVGDFDDGASTPNWSKFSKNRNLARAYEVTRHGINKICGK
jgi:hypothetical protein